MLEKINTETDVRTCLGKPHNVVLFNDEDHTKIEVAKQIRHALHCCSAEAFHIMLTAHDHGRAVVWTGGLERCELIASVLEEIRLGVKIEPA